MADVCMLVRNSFVHDSRVQREASHLAQCGADVLVLALHESGLPAAENRDGYRVERLGKDPAGRRGAEVGNEKNAATHAIEAAIKRRPGLFHALLRAISIPERLTFARSAYARVCQVSPRVVHSHDLDTLGVATLAARRVEAKLIYDCHEIWTHQDFGFEGAVAALDRGFYRLLERGLIHHADHILTTSEGHADHLRRAYDVVTPTVLRNVPSAVAARGGDLREHFQIDGPLMVYVGLITRKRGLDSCVAALQHLPDAHLVLMGPDGGLLETLRSLADQHGTLDRLHHKAAVPRDQIVQWVSSADVAFVLFDRGILSYELGLPNKLFECAFAGVPIVASEFPVTSRWLRKYRLGVAVPSNDASTISDAVRRILAGGIDSMSSEEHAEFVEAHAWEIEAKKLSQIYSDLGVL